MFPRLLDALARKLDEFRIPYMVIGGQAVLFYGEPRLTRDIDVTLGIAGDEVGRVLKLAEQLGLDVLVEKPEEFTRRTQVLPTKDPNSGLRVDFIFSFSPYERQAIERARAVKLGDCEVRFATLEDLIVHKIVAGRPRDIEDVRILLLKHPKLDADYVRRWLVDFDRALNSSYVAVFDRLPGGS
jgi:hypothetical protein